MSSIVSVLTSLANALFSTAEGSEGIVVQFFSWLTSSAVLPYFGIGIAVSLVLLAVKIVRGAIWGD